MRMRSVSLIIAAAIALVALAAGCGGQADPSHAPTQPPASDSGPPGRLTAARFAGTAATPRRPAPPLALRDSFGRRVDLKQYRGDAVIVTFVYVNCPDICPLILDNLRAAREQLGPRADELHVLAVSVDPEGDTPRAVNRFLAAHRITHQVSYLIGSRPKLEAIWHDWGVVSKRSPRRGDPHFVEHSAMVYGINAAGEITTLYPSSFEPEQIAHDVPILASQ
jgi:protein SCO1/2